MMRRAPSPSGPQRGFAYIAAVIFLVVIAGISVALLRLTENQQSTINGSLLGARASLAARAGIEWIARQPDARCSAAGATTTLTDFRADSGFLVTVGCTVRAYNEGVADAAGTAVTKHIYSIEAVACNGSGACPDAASVPRADYVERKRVASICLLPPPGNQPCA